MMGSVKSGASVFRWNGLTERRIDPDFHSFILFAVPGGSSKAGAPRHAHAFQSNASAIRQIRGASQLGSRESSLLIIDEKRGRRVSSALGLRITGAAGVLTDAAAVGLVQFEDIFQRLAQTQFRLSATIVEELRQRYQVASTPTRDRR